MQKSVAAHETGFVLLETAAYGAHLHLAKRRNAGSTRATVHAAHVGLEFGKLVHLCCAQVAHNARELAFQVANREGSEAMREQASESSIWFC